MERAPNQEVLAQILVKYKHLQPTRWTFDCLETKEDLDVLFGLLSDYQTKFESTPIVTANFITHNLQTISNGKPVFKPISDGYCKADSEIFKKYQEGINAQLFFPQLHGFSHFNTFLIEQNCKDANFLEDVAMGYPFALTTFKKNLSLYRGECFDVHFKEHIQQAVNVFYNTFGYYSSTFIPPNYWYDFKNNHVLLANKVALLQSSGHYVNAQQNSFVTPFNRKKKGLYCSTRNGRLDVHPDYNFLSDQCIRSIENAFSNQMPAIIDVHRVNFSGTFSPETRQKTRQELKKVFDYLYNQHPEVQFINSAQFSEHLLTNNI